MNIQAKTKELRTKLSNLLQEKILGSNRKNLQQD
jgi:hypothetical protein